MPSAGAILLTLIVGGGIALAASGKRAPARANASNNGDHPSGLPVGKGYGLVPWNGTILFRTPFGTGIEPKIACVWAAEMQKRFIARNGGKQAGFAEVGTSREHLPMPECIVLSKGTPNESLQYTTILVDEYGGRWPGKYGQDSSGIADGLKVIAKTAAPTLLLVPGWGPAAYVAVQLYLSQGEKASLRDTAIAAGRSQVPGGAAGQLAYDFGVGVAIEGESPKEAAINAAYNQLTPEQRAAFDYGRKVAKDAGY